MLNLTVKPVLSSVTATSEISLKSSIGNHTFSYPFIHTCNDLKSLKEYTLKGGLSIVDKGDNQIENITQLKKEVTLINEDFVTVPHTSNVENVTKLFKENPKINYVYVTSYDSCIGRVSRMDARILNLVQNINFCSLESITTNINELPKFTEYQYDWCLCYREINSEILYSFRNFKTDEICILNNYGKLIGVLNFDQVTDYYNYLKKIPLNNLGKVVVGASVSPTGDFKTKVTNLINAGVDIIHIKMVNGFNILMSQSIEYMRMNFPNIPLIAGNVWTIEGLDYLVSLGYNNIIVDDKNGHLLDFQHKYTHLNIISNMCDKKESYKSLAMKYSFSLINDSTAIPQNIYDTKSLLISLNCKNMNELQSTQINFY